MKDNQLSDGQQAGILRESLVRLVNAIGRRHRSSVSCEDSVRDICDRAQYTEEIVESLGKLLNRIQVKLGRDFNTSDFDLLNEVIRRLEAESIGWSSPMADDPAIP